MVTRTTARTPARPVTKPVAQPVAKKAATKTAKPATGQRPAKGLSLHLGLNSVSPKHYDGWSGDLVACESDAHDMAALATAQGLKPTVLLTAKATRKQVVAALRKAAKALTTGDLFMLSFSGHGGQVPDVTGEETDKQDETWCLYDCQLIDDELYLELSRFDAGVRIIVLSDSCHSGTVTRAAPPMLGAGGPRPRLLPPAIARRTYQQHKAFYDGIQREVSKAAGSAGQVDPDAVLASLGTASSRLTTLAGQFNPQVILISGCQDNQTSMDGEHNGLFTEHLLRVWKSGRFVGDHRLFHAKIRAGMPPTQSPRLYVLGRSAAFVKQRPFTITPA